MNFLNQLVFLADTTSAVTSDKGLLAIGIGLIVIGMAFSSIAEGLVCSNAVKGMARNPEAAGNLRSSMILGSAICETVAIYGLVLAILLIFVA